eukprot:scaffold178330_cov31-Prasinocladus_malaysianus.AAC.1
MICSAILRAVEFPGQCALCPTIDATHPVGVCRGTDKAVFVPEGEPYPGAGGMFAGGHLDHVSQDL